MYGSAVQESSCHTHRPFSRSTLQPGQFACQPTGPTDGCTSYPNPINPLRSQPALQCPVGKCLARIIKCRIMHRILPLLEHVPQFAYLPGRSALNAICRVARHCKFARSQLSGLRREVHDRRARCRVCSFQPESSALRPPACSGYFQACLMYHTLRPEASLHVADGRSGDSEPLWGTHRGCQPAEGHGVPAPIPDARGFFHAVHEHTRHNHHAPGPFTTWPRTGASSRRRANSTNRFESPLSLASSQP